MRVIRHIIFLIVILPQPSTYAELLPIHDSLQLGSSIYKPFDNSIIKLDDCYKVLGTYKKNNSNESPYRSFNIAWNNKISSEKKDIEVQQQFSLDMGILEIAKMKGAFNDYRHQDSYKKLSEISLVIDFNYRYPYEVYEIQLKEKYQKMIEAGDDFNFFMNCGTETVNSIAKGFKGKIIVNYQLEHIAKALQMEGGAKVSAEFSYLISAGMDFSSNYKLLNNINFNLSEGQLNLEGNIFDNNEAIKEAFIYILKNNSDPQSLEAAISKYSAENIYSNVDINKAIPIYYDTRSNFFDLREDSSFPQKYKIFKNNYDIYESKIIDLIKYRDFLLELIVEPKNRSSNIFSEIYEEYESITEKLNDVSKEAADFCFKSDYNNCVFNLPEIDSQLYALFKGYNFEVIKINDKNFTLKINEIEKVRSISLERYCSNPSEGKVTSVSQTIYDANKPKAVKTMFSTISTMLNIPLFQVENFRNNANGSYFQRIAILDIPDSYQLPFSVVANPLYEKLYHSKVKGLKQDSDFLLEFDLSDEEIPLEEKSATLHCQYGEDNFFNTNQNLNLEYIPVKNASIYHALPHRVIIEDKLGNLRILNVKDAYIFGRKKTELGEIRKFWWSYLLNDQAEFPEIKKRKAECISDSNVAKRKNTNLYGQEEAEKWHEMVMKTCNAIDDSLAKRIRYYNIMRLLPLTYCALDNSCLIQ